MIALIAVAYCFIGFITAIVGARVLFRAMTTGPGGLPAEAIDYGGSAMCGLLAGLFWPAVLICLIIARFAFPHLFQKESA